MLLLSMGAELDKSGTRTAIQNNYASFDKLWPCLGGFLSREAAENSRRLEEDYEKQKKEGVDACWNMVNAQWPCEQPTVPDGSVDPRLDRQGVLKECGILFTIWYRNGQFFAFLQQVQDRLNAMQTGCPVEPMPPGPAGGPIRTDPAFKPPTLLELIRSSRPVAVQPDRPTLTYHRPRIPQGHSSSKNLELRALIQGSINSQNAHHQYYQQDLLESLDALESAQLPSEPIAIPIKRTVLTDYQWYLRELRDFLWSNFVSSLTATENAWEAVGGATLWPSITVSSILYSLTTDRWSSVPEQWKPALLTFAKLISSLRRCDRLLARFDKNDINGFF